MRHDFFGWNLRVLGVRYRSGTGKERNERLPSQRSVLSFALCRSVLAATMYGMWLHFFQSFYWRNLMSLRKTSLSIAAALLALAATGPMARAAYVEYVQQVGSDVVATGSGTINTAALTLQGSATNDAVLIPGSGLALFGPASGTYSDEYAGFTSGSSDFGAAIGTAATSGSGDLVGVAGLTDLIVPNGYVSGASLSDTSTWAGATYSSLGLTLGPGTYTWEWGSGETFDYFVMDVEPAPAVPEPASLGLIGVGCLGLLARRRRA
jgi:hypothetical protein